MLSRLLRAVLSVLLVLLVCSSAQAGAVPMCSEDGRSIVAPPIMQPNRGLVLQAPFECPELLALLARPAPFDDRGGQLPESVDAAPRAVPAWARTPDAPRIVRLLVEKRLVFCRRNASETVYRPPRSNG